MGLSQQEFDDLIGWPDGYLAKLEAPDRRYGKRIAWGFSQFLFYWLEALGLTLLLVTKEQAAAYIAESEDPEQAVAEALVYSGRKRTHEVVRRRHVRVGYVWRGRVGKAA